MFNKITLSNIICYNSGIKVLYQGEGVKHAWLENANKYIPDIIKLEVNFSEKYIFIDLMRIAQYHKFKNNKNILKLSISTDFTKSIYEISENISNLISTMRNNDIDILLDEKRILNFNIDVEVTHKHRFENLDMSLSRLPYQSSTSFLQTSTKLPLKIIVIGSCFSRNIFRSSTYFNPSYKNFFEVVYTSFHNSLISMMTHSKNNYDYTKFNDLYKKEIKAYVEMEFDKNIFEYIDRYKPNLIIIDNYIEATAPIIHFSKNNFLTYNKYFAESIFKRNFSNCEVILPGSKKHTELLHHYMSQFSIEIEKRNMSCKVILIGSRLSKKKINLSTGEVMAWSDKMEWILSSNDNWCYADYLFLKCIPEASYIDMRTTSWFSDIDSPIIGGKSPSHYQSEYYKDIFNEILRITGNNTITNYSSNKNYATNRV